MPLSADMEPDIPKFPFRDKLTVTLGGGARKFESKSKFKTDHKSKSKSKSKTDIQSQSKAKSSKLEIFPKEVNKKSTEKALRNTKLETIHENEEDELVLDEQGTTYLKSLEGLKQ